MNDFITKVSEIQAELKAPKNRKNTFGGYNYRSCEDILEAVKPLCRAKGLMLTLSDEPLERNGWHYIVATATITDGETKLSVHAAARESESKKGMDDSQISGTASSYARKYALNGLFLIDDTKDADSDEYQKERTNRSKQEKSNEDAEQISQQPIGQMEVDALMDKCIQTGTDVNEVCKYYKVKAPKEMNRQTWLDAMRLLEKKQKNAKNGN